MRIGRILGGSTALLALGGITQIGVVPAASAAHQAGPPAACAKSFDPYKTSASVLRSCGDTMLALRHVTALPGGGKSYDYGSYTWLEPPAHFNVLRASDKQLAEYGLPTHKRLGRQWYGVMGHIRSFIQPSAYLAQVPAIKDTTKDSNNWTGHYVTGHTYNGVTGTWTEPHFIAAGCSGDAFSQWAGMGGTSNTSSSLAQTGTAFNEPNIAAHQGFIETIINGVDPGPTPINGFVPSAGDSVYASVLWTSPHYYYLLNDQTTGQSSGSILSRSDDSPDNSSAEIISERPSVQGKPVQLSDFQNVAVKNATSYWSTSTAGFVNNPNTFSEIMTGTSGSPTIATTTNLNSSSGFTDTWERCQG